jgi:hypothetical protein
MEFGAILTDAGVVASVLAPVTLLYCLAKLRQEANARRWGMLFAASLAAIQCVAALIYFGMMWNEMSRTGLGV